MEATLETGFVTDVFSEDGAVVCEVDLIRPGKYTQVLVPSRYRFESVAPQEGDKVTVQETDQGQRIVRDILSVDRKKFDGEPTGENEYAVRFDENTRIEARKRDDGSGKYDLVLEASGDILIDREGIDSPVPIARGDHTHNFTYIGKGDNSTEVSDETGEVQSKP